MELLRESATENKPLFVYQKVRVKRCGKSAPRVAQQEHMAWQTPPGARPNRNMWGDLPHCGMTLHRTLTSDDVRVRSHEMGGDTHPR